MKEIGVIIMSELFKSISQIFSPFKLLFIGYIILLINKILYPSYIEILLFAVIYLVGDIFYIYFLRPKFDYTKSRNSSGSEKIIPSQNNNIDDMRVFHANAADHSISNIHFIVHSIIIASISVLSSKQNPNFLVIIILSIMGFIIAIVSIITLLRSVLYREFWELKSDFRENYKDFIKNRYKKKPFKKFLSDRIGNHSREIIVIIFIIVYLSFIIINLYSANKSCNILGL